MKPAKIIGAILLVVVSVVLVWRALHPKPMDDEALPPSGLGQVLAEETVKALKDKGRVVVLCMPTGSVESRAKLEGFQRTIGKISVSTQSTGWATTRCRRPTWIASSKPARPSRTPTTWARGAARCACRAARC